MSVISGHANHIHALSQHIPAAIELVRKTFENDDVAGIFEYGFNILRCSRALVVLLVHNL
jgi:hypothetical protein